MSESRQNTIATGSTRLMAGAAAIVALAVALTACSSSSKPPAAAGTTPTSTAATQSSTPAASSAPASSSASKVTASGTPVDAATLAAVTKAYTTFFSGTETVAQAEAAIQNGPKLAASIATQAKNPTAKSLSVTVTSVALKNANVANVIFTLNSNGSPLLSNTPGLAVKQNGVWKIAAQTYCGLVASEGQAPAQCSDPKVTDLPS